MYVELYSSSNSTFFYAESSRIRDTPIQTSDGGANARILKMMGLRKPAKLTRKDVSEISGDRHRIKVTLFVWCTLHDFSFTAHLDY